MIIPPLRELKMDYQEMYDNLSEDLKEKVANCKTGEDLVTLAQSEGIALTDDQLDTISGGWNWADWSCGELN